MGIMNNAQASIAVTGLPSNRLDRLVNLVLRLAKKRLISLIALLSTLRPYRLQGYRVPLDLIHLTLIPPPSNLHSNFIFAVVMDGVSQLLDLALHQLIVLACCITIAMQSNAMERRV
jgi:hypothetical protein